MRLPLAGYQSYCWGRVGRWAAAAAILLAPIPIAMSDVLYLRNGGSVEGEIVETDATSFKVRTVVGAVTLAKNDVTRIEKSPSPFAEYEQRRKALRRTARDHMDLAAWCAETGLASERKLHLRSAIDLDPDFEPARRALGFVRVGGFWVEGRKVVARQEGAAGPDSKAPAKADSQAEQQKLIDAVRASWTRRIRAIRNSLLESPIGRTVEDGRRRILAISDPLAIGPMSRVLSQGDPPIRALLVEALSAFAEDEASMNIAILGLLEPIKQVREAALDEIARRNDPRTIPQYRKALKAGNETVLLRAADGLGRIKALEAVPDLIDVLTRQRMKVVERYPNTFFSGFRAVYGIPVRSRGGVTIQVANYPRIGMPDSRLHRGLMVQRVAQKVTVYRTEVREALRQITGQDFGFDRDEWRRWYKREYRS